MTHSFPSLRSCVLFCLIDGKAACLALGSVVLAVTGAEALYADMGHFGRKPIRVSWLFFVLPALMMNYMGQDDFLFREGIPAPPAPSYNLARACFQLRFAGSPSLPPPIPHRQWFQGVFS